MSRKIIPLASIGLVSIMAILFFVESSSFDRDLLASTFVVDAVYLEKEKYIEIYFLDKSGQTDFVILEILGMPKSFQKNFQTSEFREKVSFPTVPKYGWKTHPITFVVEHNEFGKIGIKTEVHLKNEPSPQIIFSKL